MKRRAGDAAKLRRPLKRNKLSENIYSSTLLYLKFLLLWVFIILADFILEFRFEFLWPFWMLLRSVYDSFKYQGLAFSMFFVCIALTSDMICFFFIPVQWIFFAASTYVWVQYIWYTEKGVCLPTMILCSIFVYMEAGVRLRDLRHMPAHLDLCRPFAAHCIGYPVVTLGFGFKSYVGYRMRKRRQQEVARENSFYMQLLQQALPPHEDILQQQPAIKELEKSGSLSLDKTLESHTSEKQMNGNAIHLHTSKGHSKKPDAKSNSNQQSDKLLSSSHHSHTLHNHNSHASQTAASGQPTNFKDTSPESGVSDSSLNTHKVHTSQSHGAATASSHTSHSREKDKESNAKGCGAQQTNQNSSAGSQNKHAQSNGVAGHVCSDKGFPSASHHSSSSSNNSLPNADKQTSAEHEKSSSAKEAQCEKDTVELKVNSSHLQQNNVESNSSHAENDSSYDKNVKGSSKAASKADKSATVNTTSSQREERRRNKNKDKEANKEKESADTGQKHSDQNENNSRGAGERALRAALAAERQARAEITQLRQQNEQLNAKLSTAIASRQADRTALTTAERRLNEERRARQAADARHHQLRGMHKSGECVWEWCRQRRSALEQEVSSLREELQQVKEHNQTVTQSLQAAEQQVSTLEARSRDSGTDSWLAAFSTLRERSLHLERSLSAETRVKLDLFSAVGEAKRQLGLREGVIRAQEKEIDELKGKIAQMLAVMPNDSFSPGPTSGSLKLRLSDGGMPCYPSHMTHHNVCNSMTSTTHSTMVNSVNSNSINSNSMNSNSMNSNSLNSNSMNSNSGSSNSVNSNNVNTNLNSNLNSNLNNSMSNLDPNATAYTPKGALVQCGSATEA